MQSNGCLTTTMSPATHEEAGGQGLGHRACTARCSAVPCVLVAAASKRPRASWRMLWAPSLLPSCLTTHALPLAGRRGLNAPLQEQLPDAAVVTTAGGQQGASGLGRRSGLKGGLGMSACRPAVVPAVPARGALCRPVPPCPACGCVSESTGEETRRTWLNVCVYVC